MTGTQRVEATRAKRGFILCFLISMLLWMLLFAPQVFEGIQGALRLCADTILPSLFPFMVLSELIVYSVGNHQSAFYRANTICRRIWGVPAIGMLSFFMGALCGFPIGVKCTMDFYYAGYLTKAETEQLLSFANNTGPSFLIAGIGYRLFGNRKLGFMLYVIQLVCALFSGWLLAKIPPDQTDDHVYTQPSTTQEHNGLVMAIRHSVTNILIVCGMVVFFSIPMTFFRLIISNQNLLLFICSFLEVGGASNLAAAYIQSSPTVALLALTNAVCFGGLSVHLQSSLFVIHSPVTLKRHVAGKLLQSALACLILSCIGSFIL